MISDWVQNALRNEEVTVTLDGINKYGFTAGETAAIIVGSCFATFVTLLTIVITVRMIISKMQPTVTNRMMM
jgi:hypothetical protein